MRPIVLTALLFAFGLTQLLLVPPFQVPDAGSHFERVFQLAGGQLIAEKRGGLSGGMIPESVVLAPRQYDDLPGHPWAKLAFGDFRERLRSSPKLSRDRLVFGSFANTVLTSPVPYLPQILAVALAMRLHLPVIAALYLAGLSSLSFCALCWFASFRALDSSFRARWIVFAAAGLPTTIFLSSSVSPDGITISLCILSVALALKLHNRFTPGAFYAFLAVTALVSLCKTIYFTVPLALLPLVASQKTRVAVVFAAALLPMLLWSLLSRDTFSVWNAGIGVDPAAQVRFILAHPFLVLRIFALQLFHQARATLEMLVGVVGWLDAPIGRGYRIGCYVLLLGAPLVGNAGEKRRWTPAAKGWAIALFLAFLLLLCLSQYITWNAVGGGLTLLQGRYFLPFLPVLLLLLPRLVSLPPAGQRVFAASVVLLYCAIWLGTAHALLTRYWTA